MTHSAFGLLSLCSSFDKTANSSEYRESSPFRVPISDPDLVHIHFDIEGEGSDTPNARVSLRWSDVEAAIDVFARKEHPQAFHLQRSRALAIAVIQVTKE
jgi:hypothetical protein